MAVEVGKGGIIPFRPIVDGTAVNKCLGVIGVDLQCTVVVGKGEVSRPLSA